MIIKGKVVKGNGVGKTLGYPTANLQCDLQPAIESGIYAARVKMVGETENAVVAIGAPSWNQSAIEVYILDWHGDLYGQILEVEVLKHISEIEKFQDRNLLIKKIESDVAKVREYFKI